MMRPTIKMLLAAMLTATPGLASAQEGNRAAWLINVGVTRLATVDKAEVTLAGQGLAGAGVKSDPQWVPSLNVTRFVKFDLGLNLSTGLPPTIKYRGAGVLATAGPLLDVRYAAPAVTLVWSPLRARVITPYVGAGVTYMHVMATRDRGLADATVDDDVAPVLQAGLSLFPHHRWGVFADVKKAYVRTVARGTVAGYPSSTRLQMDPTVLQAGVALRL